MEHLGLDPTDPLPPQESMEDDLEDPDVTEDVPLPPQQGIFPPSPTKASPSTQVMQAASKGKERKTVSLKTRTLEEQIVAGRYERALDRWGQQQQEWEKFRHLASQKTGRDKEELVVTRAEEHRERLEVMELLDRATPDEIKSGGFNWYHSLRGEGTRFVQIGNMFSGLQLPMKLHKENYVHEIIRKPLMVDLTTARHAAEASGRRRPRSWRDDEYLLTRIRKYGGRMKEMAPGLLEYDEILEPEVKSLHPSAAEPGIGPEEELMAALTEEGGMAEPAWQFEQDELAGAGMVPTEGPHAEVSPATLHFQADVKMQSAQTLRLRNTGTAVVQFEWVQNLPEQSFQESILPQDGTPYFTCHQTSGRILPGEVVQTMFSFTADKPGTFTSSWCLKTYPELKEPIMKLAMNASATLGDLHWERRSALQEFIKKEQTISLASELAEDIVEAVRLQPPPLPPLSEPAVQERLFEEVNAADGLFWSPQTWDTLSALREQVEGMVPAREQTDEGAKIPTFVPRPGRGHAPKPKVEPPSAAEPLPPLESLGVPSISRMRQQLEQLPGTEPGADKPAEKFEVMRQLERAGRTARQCPLERSPVWWMAYETVMEIALTVPGKWAATRQRNGLEPLPFLAPPEDDASPEELEEYTLKLEDRKSKLAPEEKEAEVRDIFCRGFAKNKFGPACGRFGAVAKEASLTTRMTRAGTFSLGDRLRPHLGRLSSEAIEMASNVVLYELDLGFMVPPMAADGEERPSLILQGSDLELLKQRLRGVVSVLESVPLAVLVTVHLGEPKPDKPKEDPEAEVTELQEVLLRTASLATVEPIMEILREVVGSAATSCEFVPHEVLLGSNAEFAQKVRNEDVEGKVFLLENMSAVAEETGVRRNWFSPPPVEGQTGESEMEVALHRLPWASREGWAARVFRDLQPESLVQDSLCQSCQAMTLSTGLWPRAPQRVVGPSIEVELAAFLDVLQLPIRATAAEEEAARAELEQSVADDDGKVAAPAPLLIVLGGGDFGKELLLKKLELLIGLSRLAQYEKGGVHIMAGGELATALLGGVLGMPMGDGLFLDGAIKAALREALLEVMRTGVEISLPLDVICQAEGEDPPAEAKESGNGIVVPLAESWKEAAKQPPVFLGVADGGDCYIDLDVTHGILKLRNPREDEAAVYAEVVPDAGGVAPAADAADADVSGDPPAEPAEPAEPAAEAVPAECFPGGVPSPWRVKDVGPATAEQLRMLLRRSRGALWNGSLGRCEEGFEKGTQDFVTMLESRLTGAGEDEEDEEDEEEAEDEEAEDEEGDEDSGDGEKEEQARKDSKPKERRAEFEMAAVLGRDSRKLLENLAENPANVPFISSTGEGLLQILRGGTVPGLQACDSKKPV